MQIKCDQPMKPKPNIWVRLCLKKVSEDLQIANLNRQFANEVDTIQCEVDFADFGRNFRK